MKKTLSLIKTSLNHDMNIFKINTKKQSKFSKVFLPLIIALYLMVYMGFYSKKLMDVLAPVHLEYVVLTIFALGVTIFTLIEGIYKSGQLLFNCKDDQLLFSLPIKKSIILSIRMLKFYVFELLFNSLFLLPAVVVYALVMNPSWTYYLTSIFALLLLPVVPIVLSCIIGFLISFLSSKFKGKNFIQTVTSIIFILIIFYISFNMEGFMNDLVYKANDINSIITKTYYPVGSYISLINNFDIKTFLIFLISHVILVIITVLLLGKVYYKINSGFKKVLTKHSNKPYKIKANSKMIAFVKKELNRFLTTPVFIINAGFGLVLFVIICILATIKFDDLAKSIIETMPEMNIEQIKTQLPVYMLGLICFASFMTSITSSMISLEGKTFNILKSLPIESFRILLYKVITALIIMTPCIILGDLIVFIYFKFNILSMALLLITSIIMPFVAELIGILINLKYPKLDATNDTEVVKQSMSSMISVFIGIGLIGLSFVIMFGLLDANISSNLIILLFNIGYGIIAFILWIILKKTSDKGFNNIVC